MASEGSRRIVFFAAFVAALAVYVGVLRVLPDNWWEVVFAVPWGLFSAMALDHLHGYGEFTRTGSAERLFPMLLCIGPAAGQIQGRFEGVWGWVAFGLTMAALMITVDLLARRLRPRYRGGGFRWLVG
jgi:hypothetical protein